MSYHIDENGKMDELLANDVLRQLQSRISESDYSITGKLDPGVKIARYNWEQIGSKNCFYRTYVVTIGNEDYIVMALRSYNTVVGFIFSNYFYEIGYYSQTTSNHISTFKKKFRGTFEECVKYNKIKGV